MGHSKVSVATLLFYWIPRNRENVPNSGQKWWSLLFGSFLEIWAITTIKWPYLFQYNFLWICDIFFPFKYFGHLLTKSLGTRCNLVGNDRRANAKIYLVWANLVKFLAKSNKQTFIILPKQTNIVKFIQNIWVSLKFLL